MQFGSFSTVMLVVLGLTSCSSDMNHDEPTAPAVESRSEIMVNVADTATSVSTDRAKAIAKKFAMKNFAPSRAGEREIGDVLCVNGSDGRLSMYIVNFADNRGY